MSLIADIKFVPWAEIDEFEVGYVQALEAVVNAAREVVEGTTDERPISLSTMSLMNLADALNALDEAVKTPLS